MPDKRFPWPVLILIIATNTKIETSTSNLLISFCFRKLFKVLTIDHIFFLFQSMMHIKERKDMEDAFKKAQKPWAKLLQKVEKAKNDYHTACKTERSAANQERNASGDTSVSADQVSFVSCNYLPLFAYLSTKHE